MKTIKMFWGNTTRIYLIIYLLFVATGCGKDHDPDTKAIAKSSEKQITSFAFLLIDNPLQTDVVATINEENKTIDATVPRDADITNLLPKIVISSAATINTTSAQNFTQPVLYTVTAEDGSIATYTITIHITVSQHQILQVILDANPDHILDWDLQNTVDLNELSGVTTNADGLINRLSIGDAKIATVPKEIGLLTNLVYLYIGESELTSLPAEIGQLSHLETLHLHDNFLTTLPPEIGNLSALTFFGLDNNQIISMPSEIKRLLNLSRLYLGSNQLTKIPAGMNNLINLNGLVLSNNQLNVFPIELTALTNLNYLDLSANKLTSIPKEIERLTDLKTLSLFSNELSSIPIELGKLTNLETLALNNNQLTVVPPEIGFLTNLRTLRLNTNSLVSVPRSICALKNFNTLDLIIDGGVTCALPTQKDALISIYSSNPESTLKWGVANFPDVDFNENNKPTGLRVSNKNVSRLPDFIGVLTSLDIIIANNNRIEEIPASVGSLKLLVVLEFGNNLLNTLPSSLGQLTNLASLNITNNPISSIPTEVCDLQTSNNGLLTIVADAGEGCN